MGLYWTTKLYYGRLLSKKAFDRLMASSPNAVEATKSYLKDLNASPARWILHAPQRCLKVVGTWILSLRVTSENRASLVWKNFCEKSRLLFLKICRLACYP